MFMLQHQEKEGWAKVSVKKIFEFETWKTVKQFRTKSEKN